MPSYRWQFSEERGWDCAIAFRSHLEDIEETHFGRHCVGVGEARVRQRSLADHLGGRR